MASVCYINLHVTMVEVVNQRIFNTLDSFHKSFWHLLDILTLNNYNIGLHAARCIYLYTYLCINTVVTISKILGSFPEKPAGTELCTDSLTHLSQCTQEKSNTKTASHRRRWLRMPILLIEQANKKHNGYFYTTYLKIHYTTDATGKHSSKTHNLLYLL